MQEKKINITWYGTASVRITAGSSQILIDPFFPFPDSRIKVAEDAYNNCRNILVSHGHFDHISSIGKIAGADTAVYCTKAPYRTLLKKGVGKENLRLIHVGSVFSVGDFSITAYKGKHIRLNAIDCLKAAFSRRVLQNRKGIIKKLVKITSFLERKETLCYLVEVYGKRILILGSLSLAADTAYPKEVDLAFFPYQGSDRLCEIAKSIYARLRPKAVLLTHFDDTFPPFSSEIDTSEIEDYLKKRAAVYKLRHGGSIEI
ncbi:MBL fold metallo-hydrolase [Ruminococcus flavefaciens]|uniref:L-ascorbate metabolism protein UlaG, beta-lactamase superfamily n=1 Tax=Ruminococcus flavefaciens TaxID=1265 RepID=A0A1M7H006_RUMFL|nr:MBL fold metallo-hydrolase [Ruminococcus flavefaciens]SHM21964.1 L-ascorbate metabolism protein UlaG, beta-lactamase superfamily [Ruminococcus flavefaciens]